MCPQKFYIISVSLLFLLGCSEKKKKDTSVTPTLVIQPFSGISSKQVVDVSKQLKKHFQTIKINKAIELPAMAFYRPRQRYRSDSLLNFLLAKHPDKNVTVLGITNKDISIGKNDIADWGVMGLSYRPGRSSIVSTFRLSKMQTAEQLYKLAVHELAHASGLPHCPVKSCYMRNAEGRNPLNEETGFCEKCRKYLVGRNWLIQ